MREDIATSKMISQEEAIWILHMNPDAYLLSHPIFVRGVKCRVILFRWITPDNYLYFESIGGLK